jgi:hypothetical protein
MTHCCQMTQILLRKAIFFFSVFFLDAIQLTQPHGIEMCGITLGGEEMPFGPRAISILKNDFSALSP